MISGLASCCLALVVPVATAPVQRAATQRDAPPRAMPPRIAHRGRARQVGTARLLDAAGPLPVPVAVAASMRRPASMPIARSTSVSQRSARGLSIWLSLCRRPHRSSDVERVAAVAARVARATSRSASTILEIEIDRQPAQRRALRRQACRDRGARGPARDSPRDRRPRRWIGRAARGDLHARAGAVCRPAGCSTGMAPSKPFDGVAPGGRSARRWR